VKNGGAGEVTADGPADCPYQDSGALPSRRYGGNGAAINLSTSFSTAFLRTVADGWYPVARGCALGLPSPLCAPNTRATIEP
jgi:hypothetical protein